MLLIGLLPSGVVGQDFQSTTAARLRGVWTQLDVGCGNTFPPSRPVLELQFSSGGEFALAWDAFESRMDYWGDFEIDEATQRLTLRVTDAHINPPAPVLSGEARISDDGLTLEITGIDLGDGQNWVSDRQCSYRFGKLLDRRVG